MTPGDSHRVDLLNASVGDAEALLAAARSGWDRRIVHCPAFDAAGLTRHVGTIFLWMAASVLTGARASRTTLGPVPDDPAALPDWYLAGLNLVLDVLGRADPDAATWTFSASGDNRVGWWWRRLPVEVAVHRWDAQHAVAVTGGTPAEPIAGDVAAAGIAEFVTEFLPSLLAQDGLEDLLGTLHLHATDGPAEWYIDLTAGGRSVPEHAKADTAIRGTRSDLLLWLHNRTPAEPLEVFGDEAILGHWLQLER